MARLAALNLYRRMLVHKWPLLVRVAGEANCILRGGSAQLLRLDGAVHVMAIATLNQALIHAMVEGHFEFGFFVEVAAVTKLRLGFYQEEFLRLRVVRRVAGDATNVIS